MLNSLAQTVTLIHDSPRKARTLTIVVIEKDIQEFAMTEDVMKGESQVANLAYQ
jgi:hypothetical protein